MIKSLPGERWRQLIFKNWTKLQKKYAVSNQGRVVSYTNDIKKDGNIINGSSVEGYSIIRFRVKGAHVAFLFHRLVAEYFLKQRSPEHDFVIHLNYEKKDNRAKNLRWATQQEVAKHNLQNPVVLASRKRITEHPEEYARPRKLTIPQVIKIKTLLASPERKLTHKQIALKYGISQMAVTRMKRGENWGYIKV